MRKLFFISLFLFTNSSAFADTTLPATDVTATDIGGIGYRSATQPVQIIEDSDLESRSRSSSEFLNSVPGIQSRTNGSPLIGIRGSGSNSRTLVLQDGVPLNFLDGVGANPLFFATENLGSVALLKSPATNMFGHDALTGALEFRSSLLEKPKYYLTGSALSGLGSQAFAGIPVKGESTSGQVTAYEAHSDGSFPYNDPRLSLSGTRTRNDIETTRATLLAQGRGDTVSWKTYNLVARQIGSTPGPVDNPSASSFYNWGVLSSLALGLSPIDGWGFRTQTSFKLLDQHYNEVSAGRALAVREDLGIEKRIGDVRIEVFDALTAETFSANYLGSGQLSASLNEIGLGVQLPVSPIWILQASVTTTPISQDVAPSVGLTGIASDDWRVFINYSEGYLAPSLSQKYSQTPNFIGNLNLQTETSSQYTLGLEKSWDRYTTFHFETFTRTLNNLIVNNFVAPNVSQPQNVGIATASGFEARAEFFYGEYKVIPSITYLDGKQVDTNSPLLISPQYQASAIIERKISDWRLSIQDTLWSSFYDRQPSDNSLVTIPGWNTVDLFAHYKIAEDWNAGLSVLDIFDQPRELSAGYPEPQRTLLATIQGTL